MPVYEYRCVKCSQKTSFFLKSVNQPVDYLCSHCGSSEMKRLISSFGILQSTESVHEKFGQPKMFENPDYYSDPRNIGRWTEKRMKELGMEMPDKTREMIQAAREGELPESLKDLKSGPSQI